MTPTTQTRIARSDVVGSLLRPAYLRDARQAHRDGKLDDAELRVVENRPVRDAIVTWQACGKENLAEPGGTAPSCWMCRTLVALPLRLELTTGVGGSRARRDVRLQRGAQVYAHHLVGAPDRHDFTAVPEPPRSPSSRPGTEPENEERCRGM